MQSGVALPYRAIKNNIADSLHVVIQIERRPGRRYISEVLEINSYDPDADLFDYCATYQDDAATAAAKAFRIPEADMKLYMSRINYRMEMPTNVVATNFKEAAEFALEQSITKKMPDWSDFIRPQFMKEAAPDRTT